jgi:hypothetical protein
MTPMYAKWSRRSAVETVIYEIDGPFTTKDLTHAVLTSGDKLIRQLSHDELHLAVRDALRGLRKNGLVVVEQTSSRGGGYVYRCTKPAVKVETPVVSHVLTKREAFAMAAMQGFCTQAQPTLDIHFKNLADDAVAQADALLAALEVSQ